MDFLLEYYLWILVFHIVAVMSWMSMLFYQPRLYVYHTEHKEKKDFVEVVKIQEYKMYKYIGMPAMWASIASGILMIALQPDMLKGDGWLHAKIFFALLLVAYSFSLGYFMEELAKGNYSKKGSFFRAYNEVPTVLAVLIVGYVVTKTFSLSFTIITLLIGSFIIYKVLKQKPKEKKS